MRKLTGFFPIFAMVLFLAFGGNAKAEDKKSDGGAAFATALDAARKADKAAATPTKTEIKVDPADAVEVKKTTADAKAPTTDPAKNAARAKGEKPKADANKKGGGGRSVTPKLPGESIVLDWSDKFQCIPLGQGYPVAVRPDFSLDPGKQPLEAVCLGKKDEIKKRLGLDKDKLEAGVIVERAREVDGVLSLSAAANGFAQQFIDAESKKVGRTLSQQEVQDRLDCMRAAKAWGIPSGKVVYARTAVSAHTMGNSSSDRRFVQAGRAAGGAVGAWCLDRSEVLTLEQIRDIARRDPTKQLNEIRIVLGRLADREDVAKALGKLYDAVIGMLGTLGDHDRVLHELINQSLRIQLGVIGVGLPGGNKHAGGGLNFNLVKPLGRGVAALDFGLSALYLSDFGREHSLAGMLRLMVGGQKGTWRFSGGLLLNWAQSPGSGKDGFTSTGLGGPVAQVAKRLGSLAEVKLFGTPIALEMSPVNRKYVFHPGWLVGLSVDFQVNKLPYLGVFNPRPIAEPLMDPQDPWMKLRKQIQEREATQRAEAEEAAGPSGEVTTAVN